MSDATYDLVIVGAGISGAILAKYAGLAGFSVLILEAGEGLPPNDNDYMQRFYLASAKVPEIPYTPPLFDKNGLVDPTTMNAPRPTVLTLDKSNWQNPRQAYLDQRGPLAFASTYERLAGGTARHWLGTSLRFVPHDFRMHSEYGVMLDWPIDYDELEPWYGKAEAEIGVSANVEQQAYLGITFSPNYQYPMQSIPLSLVDQAVSSAVTGHDFEGQPLVVTETPAARNSQPYQNRRVCAGNTNCIPICPIQAKYDPSITLKAALNTGKVTIWSKTVASEVLVDEHGQVSGIRYKQYQDFGGPETQSGVVCGRRYVLAAHAIETPKLLLMSKNGGRTPDGVGNESGQVGKNLMDHPLYLAWALAPEPVFGYRGPLATAGIESLRDGPFRRERAAWRIEIGNEGWNFSSSDPYTSTVDMIVGANSTGINPGDPPPARWGNDLVTQLNGALSRQFRLGFLVEQTPEGDCDVTLSDTQFDHLGLPRPRIRYNLSDYTKRGFVAAKRAADQIFALMNAKQFTTNPQCLDPGDPTTFEFEGERFKFYGAGHVVGTLRMGDSRGNSVVDRDLRSWAHSNMFIVGSAVFPTIATANPTLTIAALTLRAAETVVADLRK